MHVLLLIAQCGECHGNRIKHGHGGKDTEEGNWTQKEITILQTLIHCYGWV